MSILISGVLVNPAGVPVTHAEITFTALTTGDTVLNGFSASIVTDDNGGYAIPLEYGDYSISVQHDGYNAIYGAVAIAETSTPTTINELLKLATLEQGTTPALIVYFREIQTDVAAKLAAVQSLSTRAVAAADNAVEARDKAAQYAQSLSDAVTQAQQARTAANASATTATAAKTAAEAAATNAVNTLAGAMKKSANGADIADPAVFRANLGLGDEALVSASSFSRKRGPLDRADLDTITGLQDGVWYQSGSANATSARHYPVAVAGALLVLQNTANGPAGCTQIYYPYNSSRVFIRYFLVGGTWSVWSEIWNSSTRLINNEVSAATNPFIGVGFYNGGYGNWPVNYGTVFQSYYPGGGGISLMQRAVASITTAYQLFGRNIVVDAAGATTYGAPVEFWHTGNLASPATLDTVQTISGEKTFTVNPIIQRATFPSICLETTSLAAATVGRKVMLEVNQTGTGVYLLYRPRTGSGGQYSTFFPRGTGTALISGVNVVADANGFWKTASPVVKLFSDGSSELSSEATGISTERVSEGVYRISGCLGLNSDAAWGGIDGGISVPRCRNDLPRLWNDYQVEEDGTIIIRTFHRPHPTAPVFARNEIEGYADGEPIDIPTDVFVCVRVQMPEQVSPKPIVMHSNVYCGYVISMHENSCTVDVNVGLE